MVTVNEKISYPDLAITEISIPVYRNGLRIIFIRRDKIIDINMSTGNITVTDITLGNYTLRYYKHSIVGNKLIVTYLTADNSGELTLRSVIYDLDEKSATKTDLTTYSISELDHSSFFDHGCIYGNLFVGGDYDSGNVIMIDLLTGEYSVFDTGFGSYGPFGVGMGKIFWKKDSETGRIEPYIYLARHLAGDVHHAIRLTDGSIISLDSQGGGSPRSYIGAPLILSDTIVKPLTGGGVVSSENDILWYNGVSKIGTTDLSNIADYPNVASVMPLAKLDTGYLILADVYNFTSTSSVPHNVVLIYLDSSFNYQSHELIYQHTTSDYGVSGNCGHPEGRGDLTNIAVLFRGKIYTVLHWGGDNEIIKGYEIDLSDLNIEEYNSFMWSLEIGKMPTILTLNVKIL